MGPKAGYREIRYPQSQGVPYSPKPVWRVTKEIGNALGKVPVIGEVIKTTDAINNQTAVDGYVPHHQFTAKYVAEWETSEAYF